MRSATLRKVSTPSPTMPTQSERVFRPVSTPMNLAPELAQVR